MIEDDLADLYENAPSGALTMRPDGAIVKINARLLGWLGRTRDDIVGTPFRDLLTPGSRIFYETHVAPLLLLQGAASAISVELRREAGGKVPAFISAVVKTGDDGRPALIRMTVFEAGDRRAYEQELLRARRAAEDEDLRLRHLVGKLQLSLLPSVLQVPPGLESAAYYRMASTDRVGGDFYDLFPLSGRRWGFFLGDVSGKGVEAAAVTALARYTLRAAAVYDADPAAVLGNLNTVLHQEYRDDARFCTVVFGILTPRPGGGFSAVMACGGHPEPVILRGDGRAEYVPMRGRIVGVLPSSEYVNVPLLAEPGDTLMLYSDGITEARTTATGTPDGRFGIGALLGFAQGLAPTTATAAVGAWVDLLDTFEGGLDDDVAFMALSAPPR